MSTACRSLALGLLAACVVLVGADKTVWADTSDALCTIYEIRASSDKAGIDAELSGLKHKLKKPPLSSWTSFKLMKKHQKTAGLMKAVDVGLVPGGKLSLLYRDRQDEANKKPRLRFGFTLDDKGGKRQLDGRVRFDSGEYTLIGNGSELADGATYLLAVTCSVPPAK